MGQFASKAFDGDPYIEIMRVLPDKELCWWIQKVIWVAEGFTLAEHFGRTYPQLFTYKCLHCNGAGTVTCPHCQGYKVKRATSHNGLRLSEQTAVGRMLAEEGSQNCDHCGSFCQWDVESEWQGMWEDWERKLAYYDRSYGKIMDNWYDDVVNEGNLDEDTAPAEEPVPDINDNSISAQMDREVAKMPQRTKALMKRMGGHPYENYDMIPLQIIDPTKPLEENVDRMGMDYNWLPPEMDPQGFPEFLLQANNPIAQFEHQVRMEYLILNNLDAAIKDQPKPAMFGPSAGTVLCPECNGRPNVWSFTPNVGKLFRIETPFWMRTLSRMSMLGTTDVSAASYAMRSSRAITGSAAEVEEGHPRPQQPLPGSKGADGRRRFGEVPTQPFMDIELQAVLDRRLRSSKAKTQGAA